MQAALALLVSGAAVGAVAYLSRRGIYVWRPHGIVVGHGSRAGGMRPSVLAAATPEVTKLRFSYPKCMGGTQHFFCGPNSGAWFRATGPRVMGATRQTLRHSAVLAPRFRWRPP